MNLRVVLDDGARMPERAHECDAGADLFTPRYAFVKPGQSATIDTGVHIEIPDGYVGLVKAKSGLNVNFDLTLRDVRHEWVRLPLDADGEPIHVGDEMCGYGWPNGGVYCRAIVNEVTILVGPQDGAYRDWLMWAANECRHHHKPTIEDVLTEFLDAYQQYEGDGYDVVAEYAAKLRLAEGEGA